MLQAIQVLISGLPIKCSDLKTFVEEQADFRDCLSLTDRLSPLCCLGEANQSVPVNDTCAECDACIVDGMCIHSTLDTPSLNKTSCSDIGVWCAERDGDPQSSEGTVNELIERASNMATGSEERQMQLDASLTGKDSNVCQGGSIRRRRAPVQAHQMASWKHVCSMSRM